MHPSAMNCLVFHFLHSISFIFTLFFLFVELGFCHVALAGLKQSAYLSPPEC